MDDDVKQEFVKRLEAHAAKIEALKARVEELEARVRRLDARVKELEGVPTQSMVTTPTEW